MCRFRLEIFPTRAELLAFTQNGCIWSLFKNSQHVSGDIMKVVKAGSSDILVAEIRHFCY
jgi:hypothetical protein